MANIQPFDYQKSTNIEEHNQIVNKVNEIVEVINNANLDTINSEIANLKTNATATDTEITNIKNKDSAQDTEIDGITKSLVSNVTATFDNPSRELKISLGREASPSIDATVVIPASSETGQYSAGNGITIENNQIAVNTEVVAIKTDIPDISQLTADVEQAKTDIQTINSEITGIMSDIGRLEGSKQDKSLSFSNVNPVWSTDTTYSDYGFKGTITLTGVTSSMYAEVVFSVTDAMSGNYAPVCETFNGGLYIYGKVDDTITIPQIIVTVI